MLPGLESPVGCGANRPKRHCIGSPTPLHTPPPPPPPPVNTPSPDKFSHTILKHYVRRRVKCFEPEITWLTYTLGFFPTGPSIVGV